MKEKKSYYVSVQANSVLLDQGAAAYEFEIVADEQEAAELMDLFEAKMEADDSTYIRAHLPGYPVHIDDDNDAYDHFLLGAYRKIYELGTPETRAQIERMNVLDEKELG